MKKIFIFTVIASALLFGACVEKRNLVILDKFVPRNDQCAIEAGGDKYYTKGAIDLAFTDRYSLGFQVTNYIATSVTSKGSGDLVVNSAETNNFYLKWIELKYEWDPRPQADGRQLQLDQNLWNKTKRIEVHGFVTAPEGGQNAGAVDILTEVQAKDLLAHVNDIDWVSSPLIIKMKVYGELTDGTEIETNTMRFNIEPYFGDTIQMGSVYYEPAGGFADDQEQYDAIVAQCAFNDALVGCTVGQDSLVNCWAGDSDWMRYVSEKYCHLTTGDCYTPGFGASSVVEIIFNGYLKNPDDGGYYRCCPAVKPDEPEEEEAQQ